MFAILLISLTSIIIIKTPIRNYLPGYLDIEVRGEIVNNILKADSLERVIAIQSLYLDNITGILMGTAPLDSIRTIDSLAQNNANYDIPRTRAEEEFVRTFEEEEKYNLAVLNIFPIVADEVFFYKPVNGVLTSAYEPEIRHYGVDLAAEPKESVMSTLDGTVIYTGSDPNHGNVIHIQHKNGFLSVYKHNDLLLKTEGDQVVAGEAIALVGNTGSLSTGPHLHFELWYRGSPVNPEEYIAF
jgi:Membrane proteins related to metalloendopeptidases